MNALGAQVAWRTCRDRTARLLEQYEREDRESLRRYGTEQEYEEKEQLLQDLLELKQEAEISRASSQAARQESQQRDQQRDQQAAIDIRNTAASTLSSAPSIEDGGPSHISGVSSSGSRRQRASDMDQYCQLLCEAEKRRRLDAVNRSEELRLRQVELEMQREQLEIQREQLAIQREQLEMDREEKRRMWERMESITARIADMD